MSEQPSVTVSIRTNAAWPVAWRAGQLLARFGMFQLGVRVAMLGVSFDVPKLAADIRDAMARPA